MDVTVTPSRSGSAFQNTTHEKSLAVDRSIFVGCDDHDSVANFSAKPLGQEFRHQDFARFQERKLFSPSEIRESICGKAANSFSGYTPLILILVVSVKLLNSAPNFIRSEYASISLIPAKVFSICDTAAAGEIQIQRKAFNRSHIAAAMDLQSAQIRVGDLCDHEILDRSGHGDEN